MLWRTRRGFIRQTTSVIASTIFLKNQVLWGLTAPLASMHAWTTTGEQRFESIDVQAWQPSPGPSQPGIEIDPSQHFQTILGFGGAFTDASCYLLSQMEEVERRQLLAELVGPDGLKMSLGRTCVGASDYLRNAYSFDDGANPDPESKRFSIAHDRDYILPMLRAAQDVNPNMFFFPRPGARPDG